MVSDFMIEFELQLQSKPVKYVSFRTSPSVGGNDSIRRISDDLRVMLGSDVLLRSIGGPVIRQRTTLCVDGNENAEVLLEALVL